MVCYSDYQVYAFPSLIICTKSLKSENILLRCRFSAVLGQQLGVTRRNVEDGSSWSCRLQVERSVLRPAQVRQVRQGHPPGRSQSRQHPCSQEPIASLIMSRSLMGSRRGSYSRDGSPSSLGPERKISAPAGPPGNVNSYASPSYITLQGLNKRKSAFRKYGCQKEPEADKPMYDPSLLYQRGKDRT